jgi:thioredoxin 1
MSAAEHSDEPTRAEVDALKGAVLLEFGAVWCGYCRAIQPRLAALLRAHPDVQHIQIEDGPGQPLGRSFQVKLWPTLVFLRDGKVLRQAVRPGEHEMAEGFEALQAG